MAKNKHVLKPGKPRRATIQPDPRKPMPQVPSGKPYKSRFRTQLFETRDSGLAAYLMCHGMEFVALGTGGELEPTPTLTFVVDAPPAKWYPLVERYRTGRGDTVASASAFLAAWRRLEDVREDEQLRLARRVDDDLFKVRVQEDENAK